MSDASTHEPDPKDGDEVVLGHVLRDLQDRANVGYKKYGGYLKTNNGREALWDLYQELLDATMYTRQKILEMEQPCKWSENANEFESYWETSCGKTYSFFSGTPEENEVSYCHNCGRKVVQVLSENKDE